MPHLPLALVFVLAATAAASPPALAADWRAYADRREIDVASVRLADGLVHFQYREFRAGLHDEEPKPIDAVAECAKRVSADVMSGAFQLRAVYEGTQSAHRLDLACKLAGVATQRPSTEPLFPPLMRAVTVATPAAADTTEQWRVFDATSSSVMEIDARSIRRREGLIGFTYRTRITRGQFVPEIERPIDAVVDCLRHRHADVFADRFELVAVDPESRWTRQLDMACRLAAGETVVDAQSPALEPYVQQSHDHPVVVAAAEEPEDANWMPYDLHDGIRRELFRARLRREGNLVWFTWRKSAVEGRSLQPGTAVDSVVDCDGRQSSDVTVGHVTLRPVEQDPTLALQLDAICRLTFSHER